jgi:CheY-like chemotaxis protein
MSVPGRGLPVRGDPTRLAQVFSNLLTNASKYSDAGGRVWLTAYREKEDGVVVVRDSGVGIDPQMLPRVFDVFAQEPQSLERARGGLGLGLSIVSNLVKMHGGSVTAESEGRGKGAAFIVRLPLCEAVDVPRPDETAPSVGTAAHAKGRRVLIVDDNSEAAEMLATVLSSVGHVTRVAHDGPAALAILHEFTPDVALLDIGLPAMDGYELARRIRATPPGANARLYALTGYGQESDRRRSHEAGFDAHLVKPVDLDTVVRAVEMSA